LKKWQELCPSIKNRVFYAQIGPKTVQSVQQQERKTPYRFIGIIEYSSVRLFPEVPEDIDDYAVEASSLRTRHLLAVFSHQ